MLECGLTRVICPKCEAWLLIAAAWDIWICAACGWADTPDDVRDRQKWKAAAADPYMLGLVNRCEEA